jgi:hypothetical protein
MTSADTKSYQSSLAGRLKQIYQNTDGLQNREMEWVPFFCVEARIDFNDVRTGFRETVGLSKALEIYSTNADLLWTDDMVRDVDLAGTRSSMPDGIRHGTMPDFVDGSFLSRMENQFLQYLLRSFEAKIYRNYDLNIYSLSGESRDDFCLRCLDLFDGRMRKELDKLRDFFNRKLEQIRQKYLSLAEPREFEQMKAEFRNKDAFLRCSERIAEIFYMAELKMKPATGPPFRPSGKPELEERLISLEFEANHAIAALYDALEEKARAIDEYILHPNLKDIHFVRSCILWMPKGAA